MTQLNDTTQVLRERLLAGKLGQKGKLREQTLATDTGVSRTVVRLALGELEKEGLVIREPNKGFQIRTFTLNEVTDAILVRGTLEGMAARLCAEQGLESIDIKSLETTLQGMDALLDKGVTSFDQRTQWIELNTQYHQYLIDASKNASLPQTITALSSIPLVTAKAIVFDTNEAGSDHHRLEASQLDHWRIFEAITQRQGTRAESLMVEHARASASNKRIFFKALRDSKQTPTLPGLALVQN